MKNPFSFLFVCFLLCASFGWSEDVCHVYFVQVSDLNKTHEFDPLLNETEYAAAVALAEVFSSLNFSAIYCSDSPHAIQTAYILAEKHHCSVVIDPALNGVTLPTLFKRVGPLRVFGEVIYHDNVGRNIACVTHESLINFIGRYIHGGFKKLSNLSYIQVDSDGSSMYLPRK